MSIGACTQYYLDNFAIVEEAVQATGEDDFTISTTILPNARPATSWRNVCDQDAKRYYLESAVRPRCSFG
jgi:penicillin V acylase-like amidase (Ntn superfamily)